MNIHSGKTNSFDENQMPVSASDPVNGNDGLDQLETGSGPDDEKINLDDALDDDNENPVSQTLVDAAENSGSEEFADTHELEGEEQESKDR